MKIKYVLMSLLFASSFIFPSQLYATSWANQFVVWDGYAYVINDEVVTDIDRKIGQVTKYSDMETYTGNYSNSFKKGTPYYSIKGLSTDHAIAVKSEDGMYVKAIRNGEFTGENNDNSGLIANVIFISLVICLVIFFTKKMGLFQK